MTTFDIVRYAVISFAWSVPHLGVWTLAAIAAMLVLRRKPFVVLALAAGAALAWVDAILSVAASAAMGALWDTLGSGATDVLWRADAMAGAAAGALQWLCALLAAFGWRSDDVSDEDASPPAPA